MGNLTPTPEQQAILAAFRNTNEPLVITAGAGAGKTSTFDMIANAAPHLKFLYLAYNKALKEDAKKSMPRNVTCMTAHGLAHSARVKREGAADDGLTLGQRYGHRIENQARQNGREKARILGITSPARINDTVVLSPAQLARLVIETIERYCLTADREIGAHNTPRKPGMDDPASLKALAAAIRPFVKKAWKDLTDPDGKLRFTHDIYLKLFQLAGPDLAEWGYDVILFDEAQDSNPLTSSIVGNQKGLRVIVVGDSNQEIYAWRGACNSMDKFPGRRFTLTKSFRFGPAVADVANLFLDVLEADIRIIGHDPVGSVTGPFGAPDPAQFGPDAILCRTNGTAMSEAMDLMAEGYKVALVRGAPQIKALAEAAIQLREGKPCYHPELMAFATWGQLQDYVENETEGKDLKVFVDLVDEHTPEVILAAIDDLSTERAADVVISTAHGAKGRQWNRVRLADDFFAPRPTADDPEPEPDPAELRLAYVAVTRAQKCLDWADSLGWIRKYAARARVEVTTPAPAAPVERPVSPAPRMAAPRPVRRPAPTKAVVEAVRQAAEPVADEPGAPRIPRGEIIHAGSRSPGGYVWDRKRSR